MKVIQNHSTYEPLAVLPEEQCICPIHGSYPAKVMVLNFLDGKKMRARCPKCVAEEEAAEQAREKKARHQRNILVYQSMNIGRRYWETDFDAFNAYTPQLAKYLGSRKTLRKITRAESWLCLGETAREKRISRFLS
ncbi:MAG: hypothetical protein LBG90_04090 [Spirochaetaceae bacterium]|jgi:DNA replication protein DnaC|nr:hypothetical protein [Spirochaetaceae bacterium]